MASRVRTLAALLVLLGAYATLAGLAADRTPLFETADEARHLAVARWWATHGRPPDLTNLPPRSLPGGAAPPLAHALGALGLHAAGLAELPFLARPNPDLGPRDLSVYLHGADELAPRAEPVARLHWLRRAGLIPGALAIIATWLLGRRLARDRPGVALGAAGLLAVTPAFASASVSLAPCGWATALTTWGLLLLVDVHARGADGPGRIGLLGLVLGLGLLTSLASAALIPVAIVVLLARAAFTPARIRIAELTVGFLIVTGPWFAFNLVTYGAPLGPGPLEEAASRADAPIELWATLQQLGQRTVGELGQRVVSGSHVLDLWTAVLFFGAGGLAWILTRTRRADRRTAAIVAALPLVTLLGELVLPAPAGGVRASTLLPAWPAAAALLALGGSAWLGARTGALVLGVLFAFGLADTSQQLERAYWPPNRADDPHFMLTDVLARVPDLRRVPTIEVTWPPDGSRHVERPQLRWRAADALESRYTVHLSIPGLGTSVRTYENRSELLHDRYTVPEGLWANLPPGLPLQARILRLPDHEELMETPLRMLLVDCSETIELYRIE